MIRRARLLAVVGALAAGALGIISSTQTWLTVVLADGADQALAVPGAAAIPVLAPLSLAALALGGALSIVGRVLRYAFGVLAAVIAITLGVLTWQVAVDPAVSSVASTVTTATGISGDAALFELIASVTTTAWPAVTLVGWAALLGAGVLTLATAHRWQGSGRRYRTDVAAPAPTPGVAESRPHDAIDSWDDLSRGDDPTA
jgi:uncharacterized membrane protein (TIGR02234 family)